MKRLTLLSAILLLSSCTSYSDSQRSYERDMDDCNVRIKNYLRTKKEDDQLVGQAYTQRLVPQADAIKKSFQDCMMARGWNPSGKDPKEKDTGKKKEE